MIRFASAACAALMLAGAASAQLTITEIWPGGLNGSETTADWFELTNLGTETITGIDTLYFDDNSNDPTANSPLVGIAEIAPGESVVFLVSWEDEFASEADAITAFTDVWGAGLLAGVQIGTITGGAGLSGGGDQVNIFDGNTIGAAQIASQTYVFASAESWFWNPDTMSWNDELSVLGLFGAVQSALPAALGPDEFSVGSPGFVDGETIIPVPTDLVITEIWPAGLPGAESISDWFELTNLGDSPVNFVDSFFYDDNSADPTIGAPLTGISTIAPGESVIFLVSWEDGFATEQEALDAFVAFWGASALGGTQVGTVTGGAGLGNGDAVNLFTSNQVDAALFASQSYPAGGSEESYIWNPLTMSWNEELAVLGVFGAFASLAPATDDPAVGPAIASPGAIDGLPPEPTLPLTITEIWSGGLAGDENLPDWFELTNLTEAAFTAADTLFYDDDSGDPTVGDALSGITEIAPGESVVYLVAWEGQFAAAQDAIDAFIAAFAPEVLDGVQVGVVIGGAGLGSGDAVNIFDSSMPGAGLVASQAYLSGGTEESWVWNPDTMSWNDELAVEGVFGAVASLIPASNDPTVGPVIASPGAVDGEEAPPVLPLTITEIWAGGLAGAETIPDWFELTNLGEADYLGTDSLYYDDDSGDPTVDDQILGLSGIAIGETVVVLTSLDGMTPGDAIQNFIDVWGAGNIPAGTQIGYIENGAGLGGGGDGVTVFDGNTAGANLVAAQSYPIAGFPESYVWNPDTMSWNDEIAVAGVFGAFASALPAATGPDEPGIGSPGIIDGVPPVGPDLDNDGDVDSDDLSILLGDFGCTAGPGLCAGDTDGDGDTDSDDLGALLSAFGS